MPTFYKPGTRKNNRTFTVRGSIDGRQYEIATDTTHKRAAQEEWDEFRRTVRAERGAHAGPKTFADIVEAYKTARSPSRSDRRYLDALVGCHLPSVGQTMGAMLPGDITGDHILEAGRILYPHPACGPATRNRNAVGPAAAALHYASDTMHLIPYIRYRNEKAPEPEPDFPEDSTLALLLEQAEGELHLFLTMIIYQGFRVTETVHLRMNRRERAGYVDPQNGRIMMFIEKVEKWREVPMHPRVAAALDDWPGYYGQVFSYQERKHVYRELRPLCARLGVRFTPHMARRWYATTLRDRQQDNRAIARSSSWTSEKSVARYTKTDIVRARATNLMIEVPASNRGMDKGKKTA